MIGRVRSNIMVDPPSKDLEISLPTLTAFKKNWKVIQKPPKVIQINVIEKSTVSCLLSKSSSCHIKIVTKSSTRHRILDVLLVKSINSKFMMIEKIPVTSRPVNT